MENTYNYLKTVFQHRIQEISKNPSQYLIVAVLLCIPLQHAYSSIALGLLFLVSVFTFQKSNFKLEKSLLLPLALFLLMVLSLLWTHDFSASVKALSKGLPLLLVPFIFLLLPSISKAQRYKIIGGYSYGMLGFVFFYLIKASIRYEMTQDSGVFFYHELVTEDVNAIHVSVYIAVAAFYFLSKKIKTTVDFLSIAFLSFFLVLLSSKNVIVVFGVLTAIVYLRGYKSPRKNRLLQLGAFLLLVVAIAFTGKIRDRFLIEYQSNLKDRTLNQEIGTAAGSVYNVSVKQAWTQEDFAANDYFPGTAFRVYQIRIFKEMLQEDPILFTGYGLNASDFRIAEKGAQYHLYPDYTKKNFHNEYLQVFAELGLFGLLLLLMMLVLNIKNALKTKDFVHISFAVLMISLFLTESFLSRQRGILFFTLLFCLFNSRSTTIEPKKE